MNEHDEPRPDELRESWIEALLVSATRRQDQADRIARAMHRIETESATTREASSAWPRKRSVRWGAVGAAATVVLVLLLLVQNAGTSQSAMAAIERSLNVAAQRTTRKYLLQVEYQSAIGGTRRTDNDLYVQGNERFALRHPGLLPGTSFWLGRDGDESWVLPAFGPVLRGDNTLLSRWLHSREELDTPFLHVTTILTRMTSRGYQLERLSDEVIAIPDGLTVECQHIRAQRQSTDQADLPNTIELWASRESGMAVRLVARWELSEGETGRESVVLTFLKEEPSVIEGWFTAEGHYEGRRPTLQSHSFENETNTRESYHAN